ncbi:rod-binding protein [Alkaliphilus hydrothermalis]|uniref:Flagellar protein FlgJ n=1 Tax=Alkaliphilus hydrothermalis TaxID=1482730 RepID=A0ABS2NQC3_9FIRM|nr:rod-binding protein [Alkaliphilus hydrothermalis]MBM7615142.1 flagellar protein FlgJ [Alkaliphilus hydrothermalis]
MKINEMNNIANPTVGKINSPQTDDQKKLMEACRQFEAVFINMMLKEMRSTVPDDGLTEKSQGREIFESMYDEKLSESMSKGQGIGLAKEMYRQLSRTYNVTNVKPSQQE